MAKIVLGIGSSHGPLLALPAEMWEAYSQRDRGNNELVYPPHGWTMSFQEGLEYLPAEIKNKPRDLTTFQTQAAALQKAIGVLAKTLQDAKADITVIISDDQDEWFYENNMPRFAVYWGDSVPIKSRPVPATGNIELAAAIARGYGDQPVNVPVASSFGRFLVEFLGDHDFDVAHFNYLEELHGGRVERRYPKRDGSALGYVRDTQPRAQGLPHGFSYVVHRLYEDQPLPILPVFQNTCYPPNQPSAKRSFEFGAAIADAIAAWPEDVRVAVVASGGLSHFVVDEELDYMVLNGLAKKDAEALKSIPKHRLYSAASESLNWVAAGGAMQNTSLNFELVDYVPVYRTEAGTGGGWAFGRWR